MTGTISNMPSSPDNNQDHGWHIHQYGNVKECGPAFTGGHFDPYYVAKSKGNAATFGGSE